MNIVCGRRMRKGEARAPEEGITEKVVENRRIDAKDPL
jgi:hypothetical protein